MVWLFCSGKSLGQECCRCLWCCALNLLKVFPFFNVKGHRLSKLRSHLSKPQITYRSNFALWTCIQSQTNWKCKFNTINKMCNYLSSAISGANTLQFLFLQPASPVSSTIWIFHIKSGLLTCYNSNWLLSSYLNSFIYKPFYN